MIKMWITASGDGARLWEVASGKELYVLRGPEGGVSSAQFAPDGKMVVTTSESIFGSEDETVRLWDVASGKELQVLRGHTDSVISAQFSHDGKTLVTTSRDQTARLWRCEVCRPIEELAVELKRAVGRDLTAENGFDMVFQI